MVLHSGPFKGVNPLVTLVSVIVMAAFIALAILFPQATTALIDQGRTFVTFYFNWWYVGLAASFLIFLLVLAFSKYGRLKLGEEHEKPEFGYFTWFAMLYAAGQGIGIIFWSIAEPIMHLSQGTPFSSAVGNAEAADIAMRLAYFHWGLNAWAIYCIVALGLALMAYRYGKPLSIRYTLYPLLGEKVNGWIGNLIDIIAVFATLFGIATSLGLGVQQINSGLNYLWDVPVNSLVQVALIGVITVLALISVLTGLKRGIKYLSQANMWLTFLLLAFFFAFGPTRYIIGGLLESTGDYLRSVIPLSFYTGSNATAANGAASWQDSWQGWWTVFYWGWWMSWAPFVGVFVARVSRGRTIREFIFGVVGVSSLLSFVWLSAYGGTALYEELFGSGGISEAVSKDVSLALYATFSAMDVGVIGVLAGFFGTVLVATYFITSSDSGTLVITTILSEGDPHPLSRHRVFWGVMEGAVAAVLLLVGGAWALSTLQTAAILSALPFSLIMVLMAFSIVRAVQQDSAFRREYSLKTMMEGKT
ncbi:BCCT family transporter [Halomonas sp. MCCC 1A17488]|uniref:BCCT family transporter n=1 Tax=Billgrantia sulfidoxydans TaxID=2733484 RepID=A0ABX7W318_9GAMM|nr:MULTISPECIES: BCCT family transporter [Halomonas]MCE8016977.1 BCCT family transporter [Halomonas sp. MCCC 1A17488]MCG3240310.1 BCCT family transporter [Halomonas sp. MCCC 1A17488]QPP49820.1 BCCT family transporter [Halomonas sp. SS10-MC5]QTP53428.1 BCCT family transporter [Halomonas sulfidoxydans]